MLTLLPDPVVEHVAKAIYEAGTFAEYASEDGLVRLQWRTVPNEGKELFRTLAKVSIKAFKEAAGHERS